MARSGLGPSLHIVRAFRFARSGFLALDNNLCELQVRSLAVGRKAYLFAGSHAGAERAAILYSLLRTAALQNLDTYAYLIEVLEKLAAGCPPAASTTSCLRTGLQPGRSNPRNRRKPDFAFDSDIAGSRRLRHTLGWPSAYRAVLRRMSLISAGARAGQACSRQPHSHATRGSWERSNH